MRSEVLLRRLITDHTLSSKELITSLVASVICTGEECAFEYFCTVINREYRKNKASREEKLELFFQS